ncbi:MAG: hypothetical protein ACI9Y1_002332 [Lentisphaeria bacterium]|jgi:hypothetical protein
MLEKELKLGSTVHTLPEIGKTFSMSFDVLVKKKRSSVFTKETFL